MVVEPWMVYLVVTSSVVIGGIIGWAACLLARKLVYRRAVRRLVREVVEARTVGTVAEPEADLDLNDTERGWLEAHGIDAG